MVIHRKKFGRVAFDQIDYRLCQIRQMDLGLKKWTPQYYTDVERVGAKTMAALVFLRSLSYFIPRISLSVGPSVYPLCWLLH